MNRITEDSGETHLRRKPQVMSIPESHRAILDYFDDAGADWFGEFEIEMTR